jgi:hypothetical protein
MAKRSDPQRLEQPGRSAAVENELATPSEDAIEQVRDGTVVTD